MRLSVTIDNCQITSAMADESLNLNSLIKTDGENTSLAYEGWEIEVHIDRKLRDGDIIVQHRPSESCPKKVQKRYRLVDGYIAIDEVAKYPVHFTRTPIMSILSERFGITRLVRTDTDERSFDVDWDPLGHSGEVRLACLLSNGDCTCSYTECGESTVVLENWPEEIVLRPGQLKLQTKGSTWVILCTHCKSEDLFIREVTLYTAESNLFLLVDDLETFLENSEYGQFEDCLEQLTLE